MVISELSLMVTLYPQEQPEGLHGQILSVVHLLTNSTTEAVKLKQHFLKNHKSLDSIWGLLHNAFHLIHLLQEHKDI